MKTRKPSAGAPPQPPAPAPRLNSWTATSGVHARSGRQTPANQRPSGSVLRTKGRAVDYAIHHAGQQN